MVNKELRKYIIEQEKKGRTEKELKDYLAKQGYKKKEIDETFNYHQDDKVIFYTLTVFFSAIVSSVICGALFTIMDLSYFTNIIIILVLGALTMYLVRISTEKTKLWVFASAFVASFSSSTVFALTSVTSFIINISELFLQTQVAEASQLNLVNMFRGINPIVATVITYVVFLIPFFIFFMMKKKKDMKELIKLPIDIVALIILMIIIHFLIKFVTDSILVATVL